MDKNKIAGVDFSSPLDSLENITGSKLSDMLGKAEPAPDGDPFKDSDSEQRAWDEHKDECNGCALCEL